jgi:hypothetical protein
MGKAKKKVVKTRKGKRDYTYLGCPLTRNRSAWCYRLCVPDPDGTGQCGRIAPHSLKGEVALSIERHRENKRLLLNHCAGLERMYVADPCNEPFDPGVQISAREAELVVPVGELFARSGGRLVGSVCQKLLVDSAALAVNSIVTDRMIVSEHFNTTLTRSQAREMLIARGRLLAVSEGRFLAESLLVDHEGDEIGRGNGAFVPSEVELSEQEGYTLAGEG